MEGEDRDHKEEAATAKRTRIDLPGGYIYPKKATKVRDSPSPFPTPLPTVTPTCPRLHILQPQLLMHLNLLPFMLFMMTHKLSWKPSSSISKPHPQFKFLTDHNLKKPDNFEDFVIILGFFDKKSFPYCIYIYNQGFPPP